MRTVATVVLAGPRGEIAFDPEKCRAAIVTHGGLCPGLNTVVREVVMCLRKQYGVNETYGVTAGYRGLLAPETWVELDEYVMKNWRAGRLHARLVPGRPRHECNRRRPR